LCSLRPATAVNHFVPWSRYPRDLAHNLVLAHGGCNSRKSDLLGAVAAAAAGRGGGVALSFQAVAVSPPGHGGELLRGLGHADLSIH
jgi:hypothetical protein